jgi:hypothetical protein
VVVELRKIEANGVELEVELKDILLEVEEDSCEALSIYSIFEWLAFFPNTN